MGTTNLRLRDEAEGDKAPNPIPRCLFDVTDEPLSIDELVSTVQTNADGAVVVFAGLVRDNSQGRTVIALEYEAYPEMAEAEMERIGLQMVEKWGLHGIAMRHRTGKLAIGEASVLIVVSAPHRREAFEACSEALDMLKATVPVWKKEYFEDGTVWVGMGAG